jgi:hypothetical protein
MKMLRFLFFLMIATVSLPGASLALQSDHPSQQAPSQSVEKSADPQNDAVRNDKHQARSKGTDENQEAPAVVTRTTVKHREGASHPVPLPAYRRPVKALAANNPRTAASGSVAHLQQSSKAVTGLPNKAANLHSPAVPSSPVSVNGQQFKSSRVPGARLVASGGPATTPRGTAAINGTDMRRKP